MKLAAGVVHAGDDVDADGEWIEGMVTLWLDDEWERGSEINRMIASRVKRAYVEAMRRELANGVESDAGGDEHYPSLVMALIDDLLTFDFTDAFVNAFEVGNKVIEMLMLRDGVDVCCVSEEDVTREWRLRAGADGGDASETRVRENE